MIAKFTKQTKLEFLSKKSKLKEHTSVIGKDIDIIYHLYSVTKVEFKCGEQIRFNSGSIVLIQDEYKEVKVYSMFYLS